MFYYLKLKFYKCFSAVYNRAKHADSELVCMKLLKSFCLPIMLYHMLLKWWCLAKLSYEVTNVSLVRRAASRIFGCTTAYNLRNISIEDSRALSICPVLRTLFSVYKRNVKFSRSFRMSASLFVMFCMCAISMNASLVVYFLFYLFFSWCYHLRPTLWLVLLFSFWLLFCSVLILYEIKVVIIIMRLLEFHSSHVSKLHRLAAVHRCYR